MELKLKELSVFDKIRLSKLTKVIALTTLLAVGTAGVTYAGPGTSVSGSSTSSSSGKSATGVHGSPSPSPSPSNPGSTGHASGSPTQSSNKGTSSTSSTSRNGGESTRNNVVSNEFLGWVEGYYYKDGAISNNGYFMKDGVLVIDKDFRDQYVKSTDRNLQSLDILIGNKPVYKTSSYSMIINGERSPLILQAKIGETHDIKKFLRGTVTLDCFEVLNLNLTQAKQQAAKEKEQANIALVKVLPTAQAETQISAVPAPAPVAPIKRQAPEVSNAPAAPVQPAPQAPVPEPKLQVSQAPVAPVRPAPAPVAPVRPAPAPAAPEVVASASHSQKIENDLQQTWDQLQLEKEKNASLQAEKAKSAQLRQQAENKAKADKAKLTTQLQTKQAENAKQAAQLQKKEAENARLAAEKDTILAATKKSLDNNKDKEGDKLSKFGAIAGAAVLLIGGAASVAVIKRKRSGKDKDNPWKDPEYGFAGHVEK